MRMPRFETFRGSDGQFYWRLVAGNGQVVATGAEGYTRPQDALRAARGVGRAAAVAEVRHLLTAPVPAYEDPPL